MLGPHDGRPTGGDSARGISARETVDALREQVRRLEGAKREESRARIRSGCEALDRLLPTSGFARGTLVEWLGVGSVSCSGAGTLALLTAREALRGGGPLVVIDRGRVFYPPAAYGWGIDPAAMILVRPTSKQDEHWVLDQVLRCSSVAAVLAWPDRLDARTFRRLQLAAEMGGGLGLLVRPQRARREPSWADVRWLVQGQPVQGGQVLSAGWGLRVELLRVRGGLGAGSGRGLERGSVELEIDERAGTIHEAHRLPLATKLATPASDRRRARA